MSETPEQQTARYINGLRFNIREKMSLTPIWSVDEAYNMAIRAEDFLTQSNQRRTYSTPKPVTTQSPHDVTSVQTAPPSSQPVLASDTGSSKNQRQKQGNDVPARNSMSNPYARPMTGKCFKCGEPGHRSNECRARKAVNLVDGRTDEGGDEEYIEEDFEVAEENGEHVSFVVRRLLYTNEEKPPVQRNNIFRAYCTVLGKVCKLIIDNGSCDNIISQALVEHLNLPTQPHPKPYKLGWIREGPSVTVSKVCRVPISIGKSYEDHVICEVIDMDACHILLGRPWQYDVDATHRGKINTYEFFWNQKKIVIPPAVWAKSPTQKTCVITILDRWKNFVEEAKDTHTVLVLIAKDSGSITDDIPVIRALHVWAHYLRPGEFIIYSDHEALKYFRSQKHLNKMHARWAAYLEQFTFLLKHKSGATNRVADALSRRRSLLIVMQVDLLQLPSSEKIHKQADTMASQVQNVQQEVRAKLETSNAKYKTVADKKKETKTLQCW
nr:Zinc finger, CCHC-type [Ipomoea batatas]